MRDSKSDSRDIGLSSDRILICGLGRWWFQNTKKLIKHLNQQTWYNGGSSTGLAMRSF